MTHQLHEDGFSIIPDIYTQTEINHISEFVEQANTHGSSTVNNKNLFAIRCLLLEMPGLAPVLWNAKMMSLLESTVGNDIVLSKAIYFDKPQGSNWFVAYHQDLTINVIEKTVSTGFKNWTNKRGVISVQPPLQYNRTYSSRCYR